MAPGDSLQARREGFEPPTPGFGDRSSTVELPPYEERPRGRGADLTAVPRPRPTGVACHVGWAGSGRPARPLRSRSFHENPRPELSNTPDRAGPQMLLDAGRSASPERPGSPARRSRNAKAPRLREGGGALDAAKRRVRVRALRPQRTTSRELCRIMPVPPPIAAADERQAAESLDVFPTTALAERRGARLRRRPERERRGR